MNTQDKIKQYREVIRPSWVDYRTIETDRQKGLERPVLFKVYDGQSILLDKEFKHINQKTLSEVISNRRSLRKYKEETLTKEEVSYLLWETCRVMSYKENAVFRTIPTGGATNAMEHYVYLQNIEGIKEGLYHYVQHEHRLVLLKQSDELQKEVNSALFRQLRGANFTLFITAVPYRSEYKYSFTSHKMIAIEAGHAGQNLSLAAEVIDCGAVCLAAYNQDLCDELLNLNIDNEFTTYAITVGKR